MYLSTQTLISAAAVLAAAGALLATYNRAYDWLQRQKRQDAAIEELKAEQPLLPDGGRACVQGLKEQCCNGPGTEAIGRIEKHLNQRAHK